MGLSKYGETTSQTLKSVESNKEFSLEWTGDLANETQPSTLQEPPYAPTDSGYASLIPSGFQGGFKHQPRDHQITHQPPDIIGARPTVLDKSSYNSEIRAELVTKKITKSKTAKVKPEDDSDLELRQENGTKDVNRSGGFQVNSQVLYRPCAIVLTFNKKPMTLSPVLSTLLGEVSVRFH
jgi:hypothetical protein